MVEARAHNITKYMGGLALGVVLFCCVCRRSGAWQQLRRVAFQVFRLALRLALQCWCIWRYCCGGGCDASCPACCCSCCLPRDVRRSDAVPGNPRVRVQQLGKFRRLGASSTVEIGQAMEDVTVEQPTNMDDNAAGSTIKLGTGAGGVSSLTLPTELD